MVQLGFISADELTRFFASKPPVPHTIAECGLPETLLIDLLLKVAFFVGHLHPAGNGTPHVPARDGGR